MAERSDGCNGETLLAPRTRKKRLRRKITKDCYWIGLQENIGMFSKSKSHRARNAHDESEQIFSEVELSGSSKARVPLIFKLLWDLQRTAHIRNYFLGCSA